MLPYLLSELVLGYENEKSKWKFKKKRAPKSKWYLTFGYPQFQKVFEKDERNSISLEYFMVFVQIQVIFTLEIYLRNINDIYMTA